MPTFAEVSRKINQIVTERDGEWCGMPMPLPGLGLVLEDRHPGREKLDELQAIVDGDQSKEDAVESVDPDLLGWREINRWRGRTLHGATGWIVVLRHIDGRTTWGLDADLPKRNKMLFGPLETFTAWHLDTELTAIDKLATLLTEHMFRCYVLTGSFLETSKRSGLTYFFRRCRPTVVLSPHRADHSMRVLACLCLHPIGYYRNTFGGAMVPTDDIIAHLLLLRGDEHMLWKRANQHPPLAPESGL